MSKKKKQEAEMTLKNSISGDLFEQLKEKKAELEKVESVKKEEERLRKIEEKKQREKNKSFEELLNESNMNWKNYKD
ncbi:MULTISPECIES: YqkE family protein [Bacillaceae]|uniref:YqkE family protein n=1 Tax=Bacillaceae TaxID=186817 RepID=UPI001C592C81|nr:YqkE family protein [Rossellomorea sp. YZS02]MBW3113404.1 YqkE family protein [Bacillus sp. MCCB 382]MDX8344903.1 YqkE family protein [Rossellomorea sp. YZS02]